MQPNRLEIVKQVVLGNLDESYITVEEARELLLMVEEAVMDKELNRLSKSNPMVFEGIDKHIVHW